MTEVLKDVNQDEETLALRCGEERMMIFKVNLGVLNDVLLNLIRTKDGDRGLTFAHIFDAALFSFVENCCNFFMRGNVAESLRKCAVQYLRQCIDIFLNQSID